MQAYTINPADAIPAEWYQADEPTPLEVLDASAPAEGSVTTFPGDCCEDEFEPLVIGGRPWYECPYPVAAWDGPRVRLADAPSQARPDRTADAYPAF